MREWHETILAIPDTDDLWSVAEHLTRGIQSQGTVRPPLKGHTTSHPVWCALWHIYHNIDMADAQVYEWLQAHLLAAHIRFMLTGEHPRRADCGYNASMVIRKAHHRVFRWLILEIQDVIANPGPLANRLRRIKDRGSASTQRKGHDEDYHLTRYCGYLAEYIADAHQIPMDVFRETTRSGSGGKRSRSQQFVDAMGPDHSGFWYYSDNQLLLTSWGTADYRAHGQAPCKASQDDLSASGIAPYEFDVDESAEVAFHTLLGDTGEPARDDHTAGAPGQLPPLPSIYARARGMARRIAMDTQRLRVEPSRIRLNQLHKILHTLEEVFSQASTPSAQISESEKDLKDRKLRRETALLASIALISGTPPSAVRGVQCVARVSDLPVAYQLAYNPDFRMWMRPYVPPPRHPLGEEYREHLVATWPRVVFEDILGVGQHLRNVERPFTHRDQTYKKNWDKTLAPLLERAGVERRWRRFENLASILPSWFAWAEEGQHLPAALLFDSQDPLARVHHFYTAWQRSELARIYYKELHAALDGSGLDEPRDYAEDRLWSYRPPSTEITESWVGNDRLPRAESISGLVNDLRQRLTMGVRRSRHLDVQEWLQTHNLLTAYTALGLTLAAGGRAIRTPVPDLTARHSATGTLALQEKDRADGAHARLVVLPQAVLQQIEHYLTHLVTLFTAFPALPITLSCPATKFRDRSAYGTDTFELDLRKTCFFLDAADERDPASWRPVELTGQRLRSECDRIRPYAWPFDNAGRHLLRSYLTGKGCPATLINTHLGHWHYGEEPWGHPSTFDPVRYRQTIGPYLEELMEEIGYRSLSA
ncbi:hypothetical protein LRF89_11965 [Halorhodospira sp. 9621]|uniref:hypothetical protein n=1 Tax=Halorhodospira sp. 9621 TaxID=2899135 RepID=UPI001EE785C2|nr:hypothetical protein [Halorhodospira sp. 9621]MCG5534150.1 hypothetical protein [Halorhodospira sp. 9621]